MQWVQRTHVPTAPHSVRFLPIGTAGKTRRGTLTDPLHPRPATRPLYRRLFCQNLEG